MTRTTLPRLLAALALTLACQQALPAADPPADATAVGDKKVKFYPEVLSWKEAKAKCEELGGRLAVVTSREQNDKLTQLVKDAGKAEAWLGLTDEAREGVWVWVDGSAASYTNWNAGQPNNKNNSEHYALLWAAQQGKWADQPNRSTQHQPGYLCEWAGAKPEPKPEPAGDVRETTHEADDLFPKTRRLTPHVDGKPHGLVKAYDAKNRLVFTEEYVRGELTGVRTAYRPDGTKFSVMPFANGKFDGRSTAWYPDGTVANTFDWKEGKPHGKVTIYYPGGQKKSEMTYREGRTHGPYASYTPAGELYGSGEAANGKSVWEKTHIRNVTPAQHDEWSRMPYVEGLRSLWEAEWTPLFNGKDLTGWKTGGDPKKQAIWTVRDGVIRGEGNETFGFLYTEAGDYENFHLRVEARVNAAGNSGVTCRVPNAAEFDRFTPAGFEAQIAVTGSAKTGSIFSGGSAIRAVPTAPHAADEWFTMDVIVKDGRAVVLVNGKQTAEAPLDARTAAKGLIGLQKHSARDTVVEFRKVEVRRLPASPTPKAPPAPRKLVK
jgi:antitoxin component YwqK of YwqJK toxin-antitoxin module